MKRSGMKQFRKGLLLIVVVLCAVMMTGCTQPSTPVPGTPVPGTPVATGTITLVPSPPPGCVLIPGPVQTVPSYESVDIQVMKNSISTDPYIMTTFAGGKGLGMVVLMETTVTRSDCVVENAQLPNPQMGSNITLMGTTGTDLVVVNVTMTDGMTYTVVNRLLPFQSPPPLS
jgi:hypothetical protein